MWIYQHLWREIECQAVGESTGRRNVMALTVRSDNANAAVHVNTKVNFLEDYWMLFAVTECHPIYFHHRSRELGDFRKVDQYFVLLRAFDQLLSLGSLLSRRDGLLLLLGTSGARLTLALFHGLSRFGLGLALTLELAQALLLLFVFLLLLLDLRALCLLEAVVVSLVGCQLEIFNVKNFVTNAVEEVLIVRDYEKINQMIERAKSGFEFRPPMR